MFRPSGTIEPLDELNTGTFRAPGDESFCEDSLHVFDADTGTDWHDYSDHEGVTVTSECDKQPCPNRYNNQIRLWVPRRHWREDDLSTHVPRPQTLLPEERWVEHNQHPESESPRPEFTAFLAALTESAANTPQVPTLELPEAGPSTAAPPLRVGQSRPQTYLQTPAAPVQTVPKANPTPASVPAPPPQESVLRDQIDVRHVDQPHAPPPTQADLPALTQLAPPPHRLH